MNYQWQYFNGSWNNVVNGTPAGSSYSKHFHFIYCFRNFGCRSYQYQCLVSATGNGCDNATSNTVTVTVAGEPTITVQPTANTTICGGSTATLNITATGGTPSLTYQWQSNTTGCGGSWSNITGATNSTYTTDALTQTTYSMY